MLKINFGATIKFQGKLLFRHAPKEAKCIFGIIVFCLCKQICYSIFRSWNSLLLYVHNYWSNRLFFSEDRGRERESCAKLVCYWIHPISGYYYRAAECFKCYREQYTELAIGSNNHMKNMVFLSIFPLLIYHITFLC